MPVFSFHLFISASVAVALQLIFLLLCSRRLATFFFFLRRFSPGKDVVSELGGGGGGWQRQVHIIFPPFYVGCLLLFLSAHSK